MINKLIPKRLATQLLLLLSAALLVAFVVALLVTLSAQRQNDRETRDRLAAERVGEIVITLEALAADKRQEFAKKTRTRTTNTTVEPEPSVRFTANNDRSRNLVTQLTDIINSNDIRASVLSRNEFETSGDPRDAGRNREVTAVSVLLEQNEWLNYNSREPLTWYTKSDRQFMFFVFGVSMISVLGVAWFFVRQLTRPVEAIAVAARHAANGDRSARIATQGPIEFQEAAIAFNSMQNQIEQFESERIRTIAAVGHDLRTPITSLRVRAEMIEDPALRLPMISTLAELTVMADGLVTYARHRREEDYEDNLYLHSIVENVAREFDVPFVANAQPLVTGGPISLSRAFRNLIDNASRYASGISVSLSTSNNNAIVCVEDNGPGIKDELIDTIFSPFVRGEESRSTATGGHGLGLTISQEIIRSHGGTINLVNKDGKGLLVTVSIPVSKR